MGFNQTIGGTHLVRNKDFGFGLGGCRSCMYESSINRSTDMDMMDPNSISFSLSDGLSPHWSFDRSRPPAVQGAIIHGLICTRVHSIPFHSGLIRRDRVLTGPPSHSPSHSPSPLSSTVSFPFPSFSPFPQSSSPPSWLLKRRYQFGRCDLLTVLTIRHWPLRLQSGLDPHNKVDIAFRRGPPFLSSFASEAAALLLLSFLP